MVYYKKGGSGNMYSKDSYNYGRHGRKRRLKSIPVIITLLVVILILGGIYFLLFNEKINMKIIILIMKQINNMEQYNTMKKKMMIFTFHYTILN